MQHANGETTHDVDDQNEDACHRVTAYKLGCTIHRAKKISFVTHFAAASFGFFLVNQTSVEVSVDRHLFARHRIQGEAGAHFCHALSTLGHHNEVDDHQNRKHDQAHRKVTADQEVAEGLNDSTRSTRACVPFQQHHTGGGDVE